jgi:soluble lytic murein transglycosylase-like protein
MKLHPEIRALYERVRLRGMRVWIGVALMAPAAAMVVNGQFEPAVEQRQKLSEEEQARLDAEVREASAKMVERERELVVLSFAREFRIPLDLASSIHKAAVENDISPRIAFGLVRAESEFKSRAVSPVGAVGLTQLMPGTARAISPGVTRADLMKPDTNLRIGFKYLRSLLEQYDGNEKLALTAYNRGPGTVNRVVKRGGNPDNGYAEMVLTGESKLHTRLMNQKFRRR